jgi:hypothetical protein
METLLLVLGGAVEGFDLSPGPELIGPAAGSVDGRPSWTLSRVYYSPLPAPLTVTLR